MATLTRLRFSTVITYLALLFGSGFAQRPTNASVCDFYAQARYGANNSATQLMFIQNVVCLAFEGGSSLNNVSAELTGILRPGKFNGIDINLLQYFNGSRASTNVNNAPIGINWLDDGGTTPLAAFLSEESQPLVLANTSNQQYVIPNRLFNIQDHTDLNLLFPVIFSATSLLHSVDPLGVPYRLLLYPTLTGRSVWHMPINS
jgi:hypothetical protein